MDFIFFANTCYTISLLKRGLVQFPTCLFFLADSGFFLWQCFMSCGYFSSLQTQPLKFSFVKNIRFSLLQNSTISQLLRRLRLKFLIIHIARSYSLLKLQLCERGRKWWFPPHEARVAAWWIYLILLLETMASISSPNEQLSLLCE